VGSIRCKPAAREELHAYFLKYILVAPITVSTNPRTTPMINKYAEIPPVTLPCSNSVKPEMILNNEYGIVKINNKIPITNNTMPSFISCLSPFGSDYSAGYSVMEYFNNPMAILLDTGIIPSCD